MFDILDIDSDFWSYPELKLIFKKEHKDKVPSKHMWAIAMYLHPKSKLSDFDSKTKASLIKSDYLEDPKFDFDKYKDTMDKFKNYVLTKPQRLITTWGMKIDEIQLLIEDIPVNVDTYEIVTKMMKDLNPLLKQYKEIYKMFMEAEAQATHGGVEESLLEKGLLA